MRPLSQTPCRVLSTVQNSARRPFVWVANETTNTRCVREVQQQPLSLFNIPLIWAATGNESRVLDRLVKTTEDVREPVELRGASLPS